MSAHTPGPWFTESPEGTLVYSRSDEGSVCQLKFLKGRHGLGGRRDPDEVDANACLIAAAPEMLEALKNIQRASKLQDAGNFTMELRAALQIASAAIAKAEGRT